MTSRVVRHSVVMAAGWIGIVLSASGAGTVPTPQPHAVPAAVPTTQPRAVAAAVPTTQPRAVPAAAAVPTLALSAAKVAPVLALGVGDTIGVRVYGKPELDTTTYIADDGTVPVPLAGNVLVAGLSPATAGQRIAEAFRAGGYLVKPDVTVMLVQARTQQVSVLGAVRTPGRFAVDAKTTVLDALALAGGTNENGADVVMLLRTDATGKITRHPINLKGLAQATNPLPTLAVRGGDSIFVPLADQYYINGEVHTPNAYRLEDGMTVVQAIARSGGVTTRGSPTRIEIKRKSRDGRYTTRDGTPDDVIQRDDVIRIKERIF